MKQHLPALTPAYNYDLQDWVTGEAGHRLAIAQARDHLACATGPQAADYVRLTCKPGRTQSQVAAAAQAELTRLLSVAAQHNLAQPL